MFSQRWTTMFDQVTTNTNLIVFNRERNMRTMVELIPIYHENGYSTLDLNFCEMMNPSSDLKDEKKAVGYIETLKRYRRELEVNYFQCHLPYATRGQDEMDISLIKKALSYCEMLEIPQAVIHPIKASVEKNIEYFETLRPFIPTGTKLALENMENTEEIYSSDQLLTIVSSLSFDAGICLDTGHANMTCIDIPKFIEDCSEYLIATHIADNDGTKDQHLLPGFGNIRWEDVIPAFRKYYSGYLNYEAMFFSRGVSEKLSREIISLSRSIGSWLLHL